jgi:putative transposase
VTKTRDKKAALKFLKKAMRKHGRPEVIVTDRLRSYRVALKETGAAKRQKTGRWLNNQAENSHLPFRRQERAMLRFSRMQTLQKFVAVHTSVSNHFNQERYLYSRANFKLNRAAALAEWRLLCSASVRVFVGRLRRVPIGLPAPPPFPLSSAAHPGLLQTETGFKLLGRTTVPLAQNR